MLVPDAPSLPLEPSRPRCSGALVAALVTLLAACGAGSGAPEQPARQIYLLNLNPKRISVDGREADLHRTPLKFARLKTLECSGDFRRALLVCPGSQVRFRSVLRAGSLCFGVGFGSLQPEATTAFRLELVAIGPSGSERSLWEAVLSPPKVRADWRWQEVRVELGEPVEGDLVLRTSLANGSSLRPGEALPGWGNPRLVLGGPKRTAPPTKNRNVIVFLVDTLRQDRLGLYGNEPSPTPNLDRLAQECLVFTQATAAASWTKASVGSLLTSRPPSLHGAEDHQDRLGANERTLGHVFSGRGYHSAAFGFNTWIFDPKFHFGDGFDTFVEVNDRTSDRETRSDAIVDEVLDWVGRNHHQPFFLYVHTIDPHAPYEPLPEVLARIEPQGFSGTLTGAIEDFQSRRKATITEQELAHLLALYEAEIAFNDEQVGRLVQGLRALGLWRSAPSCSRPTTARSSWSTAPGPTAGRSTRNSCSCRS